MKQNINNNRNENSNATRAMVASVKAMINAEYLQRIDLVKYGIQVFAAYLDNEEPREYYVIVAAERDIKTGRYYFIDRDGVRIAWSRLNADTLAYACRDFIDQVNADKTTEKRAYNSTLINNATREHVAEILNTIAEAVSVFSGSHFPLHDIAIDINTFNNWANGGRSGADYINPDAPLYVGVREQGSECGTLQHVKERCAVLGRPVYMIKIEHATDEENGRELAGRYAVRVQPDPERHSEPTEPATAAEGSNTNPEATEPATEPESEPQSEPKAPTLAEIAADYAAGTADSIRRRWHSYKNLAARVALTVAPVLAILAIFAITGAVFYWAVTNVPAWVESLPILPRAFVGVLFIFLPTMGAEMLVIKALNAIDRRRGWFGFNPCGC